MRYKLYILPFLLLLFFCCNLQAQDDFVRIGMASFYHDYFEGRKTANGESFKQNKLTCAHRTLPFGTELKVTNLENGKNIIVRVNDRGPYSSNRILDLTKSGAKKLDFVKQGETKVEIELYLPDDFTDTIVFLTDTTNTFYKIETPDSMEWGFTLKIATYTGTAKLMNMVARVKNELDRETFVQTIQSEKGALYRLYVGRFRSKKDAREFQSQIKTFYPDSYIVEMK